tara:strand:- start:36 stop:356 length:321 start_codon:yes stop_codon:yes gene_type:complete
MESSYIEGVKKNIYEILDNAWQDEKFYWQDNISGFGSSAFDNHLINYEISYNNGNWFDILIYINKSHKELYNETFVLDDIDKMYKFHNLFIELLFDSWYQDRSNNC